MSENIKVSVADGVCTVVIARPEKKNSLTRTMYAGLAAAIEESGADPAVRCLLLTGEGGVFCAGNDIGEFRDRPAPTLGAPPPASRRFYTGLAEFPKPVVAAVNGVASAPQIVERPPRPREPAAKKPAVESPIRSGKPARAARARGVPNFGETSGGASTAARSAPKRLISLMSRTKCN